jgi:hypothetical protein
MTILCFFYWLYSLTQQSSFRNKAEKRYGGQIADEVLILGPLECTLHTLVLLFLPLLLYIWRDLSLPPGVAEDAFHVYPMQTLGTLTPTTWKDWAV